MGRHTPLTDDDRATIVRLWNDGLPTYRIGITVHRHKTTVRRALIEAGVKQARQCSRWGRVVVEFCPDGDFSRGAEFSLVDLYAGVRLGTWRDGMVFAVAIRDEQYQAVVRGSELIRLDTQQRLRTKSSSTAEWIECEAVQE